MISYYLKVHSLRRSRVHDTLQKQKEAFKTVMKRYEKCLAPDQTSHNSEKSVSRLAGLFSCRLFVSAGLPALFEKARSRSDAQLSPSCNVARMTKLLAVLCCLVAAAAAVDYKG